MVPSPVAKIISERLTIPTVGIGAGNWCDGQILVTDDLLGKFTDFQPRFVRRYANLAELCNEAINNYASDVRDGAFPDSNESFTFPEEEEARLRDMLDSVLAGKVDFSC
jgi:3-methyl-2-oxobutanoate hydroxymethyltransferase